MNKKSLVKEPVLVIKSIIYFDIFHERLLLEDFLLLLDKLLFGLYAKGF